jgi:hypothetical protein
MASERRTRNVVPNVPAVPIVPAPFGRFTVKDYSPQRRGVHRVEFRDQFRNANFPRSVTSVPPRCDLRVLLARELDGNLKPQRTYERI